MGNGGGGQLSPKSYVCLIAVVEESCHLHLQMQQPLAGRSADAVLDCGHRSFGIEKAVEDVELVGRCV